MTKRFFFLALIKTYYNKRDALGQPAPHKFQYFEFLPIHNWPKEIERSFVSTVCLPSTLICQENGVFLKRSSNRRNLKTPALHSCEDGKHFESKGSVSQLIHAISNEMM